MTINDKIRDKKLQYDINGESAKISALSSGKIDKQYEEILPPDQSRLIEQTKFTYSPLVKAFEKQIKTNEDQGNKLIEVLKLLKLMEHHQKLKLMEGIFSKDLESSEIKNKINEIEKFKEQINRNDSIYESCKYVFDFRRFRTIRSLGDSIFNSKITIGEADKKQSNLLDVISICNNIVRPRSK